MTEEKILETLKELIETDDQESHKKIIEIIDKELSNKDSGVKKQKLELLKNKSEIRLLELELEGLTESDKKNQIHLTGRIIKLYKKRLTLAKSDKDKNDARYKLMEYQKQQKEYTKDFKKNNPEIKISEKVALTIKDIATSIEIFLNKHDIIKKSLDVIKNVAIGSVETVAFMAAISLISPLFGGVGFTLTSLASTLPIASYIGLTGIIRNCLTKTEFQQYQYYQSDKYKDYIKKFKEENKELLVEFNSLLESKSDCKTIEEKIQNNKLLINKLDEISSLVKDEGLRRTYELQAFGFLQENKEICEKVVNDYKDEKNDDKEKFKAYQKELSKINFELFKRGNSIKDAVIFAGKQAGLSFTVTVIAKALITLIAPHNAYSIQSIKSFIIPLCLAITNGIISIPTYTNKLKYYDTREENEIEPNNKDAFDKLFGKLDLQAAY